MLFRQSTQKAVVALRKESVDRNVAGRYLLTVQLKSLSARRAWIEIRTKGGKVKIESSRSPQGERG